MDTDSESLRLFIVGELYVDGMDGVSLKMSITQVTVITV